MKRFIINTLILTIPLGIYLMIILIVDPYNYLDLSKAVDNQVKRAISLEVEPHLFKLIAFENHPQRNVTLGDSRTDGLFQCMDYNHWANLAYGGGSLKEIVQTFWWAVEKQQLDTVLIGLNLNLYNKYNKRFWVEETIETKKNFFSYAFNKFTFRSTFLIIKSFLSNKEINFNEISLSKEEFWKQHLKEIPDKFFGRYAYPDDYFENLKEISTYCTEHGIKLIFWVPPTHIDFQDRVKSYHMEEANETFINDLVSLGDVFDYNFRNDLTTDKESFRDPMHFTQEVAIRIRDEVLGHKTYIAKQHISASSP